MNSIAATKPGTVNGHKQAIKAGVSTKSMVDAQLAAAKLDAVIIPINGGQGNTLVSKAEANRRALVEAEKAKLAAAEAPAAQPVVETTEQVVQREVAEGKLTPVGPAPKVKKPYEPRPLSGAPAVGKAPQKGQLPLGLLRALVLRNPNSETLKAALAAAESGAAPVKKAKKGKAAK